MRSCRLTGGQLMACVSSTACSTGAGSQLHCHCMSTWPCRWFGPFVAQGTARAHLYAVQELQVADTCVQYSPFLILLCNMPISTRPCSCCWGYVDCGIRFNVGAPCCTTTAAHCPYLRPQRPARCQRMAPCTASAMAPVNTMCLPLLAHECLRNVLASVDCAASSMCAHTCCATLMSPSCLPVPADRIYTRSTDSSRAASRRVLFSSAQGQCQKYASCSL